MNMTQLVSMKFLGGNAFQSITTTFSSILFYEYGTILADPSFHFIIATSLMSLHYFPFIVAIFMFCCKHVSGSSGLEGFIDAKGGCIEREKQALLYFKQGVIDYNGRLSSWGNDENKDCCQWTGVRCSNHSSHVIELNLRGSSSQDMLGGNISSSLRHLHKLIYLDLSYNFFVSNSIPEFISSFSELQYLNLSVSGSYNGSEVPYQLGKLSRLQVLDFRGNSNTRIDDTRWISRLSELKYLDLSHVDLIRATNWGNDIHKLPSLVELYLQNCNLPNIASPSPSSFNSSVSLSKIDFSDNSLTSSIYPWLSNYTSSLTEINLSGNQLVGRIPELFSKFNLRSLDMSYNYLNGNLPMFFWNSSSYIVHSLELLRLRGNELSGVLPDLTLLSSLRELYLDFNLFNAPFTTHFGQISSLRILDLSGNKISGTIPDLAPFSFLSELRLSENHINGNLPESTGQLFKLEFLDASSNNLEGTISDAHLLNLSSLRYLDLSHNPLLALEFISARSPAFKLESILLSSCKLGPYFPKWLQSQDQFIELDISNAEISDTVPRWFWDLPSGLSYLNLSNNQLLGILPEISTEFEDRPNIDLSSNRFSGPLPLVPPNLSSLILSRNMFSGSVDSFMHNVVTSSPLTYLDLSDNLLSGELSDNWMGFSELKILRLANNNFTGKIPNSIGSLFQLEMLAIRKNSFSGKLPSSLRNCTMLRLLDVGDNKLSGKIPAWLGKKLSKLVVLSLRSNKYHSIMPLSLCDLINIQILDLSMNNISGTIPKCFDRFMAMAAEHSLSNTLTVSYVPITSLVEPYASNVWVVWKGRNVEFKNTLGLVKSLDLSSNRISGEIPSEITSLVGLVALNLSRTNLTGVISPSIGKLRPLDSFDLSRNGINGQIPTSLSSISNLGVLDLSYNNLSGPIPSGTQLQSFEGSVYEGNPGLCGVPLPKRCPGHGSDEHQGLSDNFDDVGNQESGDEFITLGFYVSLVLGFAFGFWGVCGTLVIKESWRQAYFKFFKAINDWLYLVTTVSMARGVFKYYLLKFLLRAGI